MRNVFSGGLNTTRQFLVESMRMRLWGDFDGSDFSGNVMNKPGTGRHSKDVQENSNRTAKQPIDIAEEQLGRYFPGGDIEQIGSAETMQNTV